MQTKSQHNDDDRLVRRFLFLIQNFHGEFCASGATDSVADKFDEVEAKSFLMTLPCY